MSGLCNSVTSGPLDKKLWRKHIKPQQRNKKKNNECIISKKSKWPHFLGELRTMSHHIHLQLQIVFPHTPIHYYIHRSVWLRSVSLFSAPLELPVEMVVVWSQGPEGSVDMTFKAWSSMPPLSQEMSLSHGSVCHRSTNGPPGNPPVPTVSISVLYLTQSSTAAQPRGSSSSVVFLYTAIQHAF